MYASKARLTAALFACLSAGLFLGWVFEFPPASAQQGKGFPATIAFRTGRTSDCQVLGCRYREGVVGAFYSLGYDRPELFYFSVVEEGGKQPCGEGSGAMHLANMHKLVVEGGRKCGGNTYYSIATERRDGQSERVYAPYFVVFHLQNPSLPVSDEFVEVGAIKSITFK
jgi:hypothetical protein